MKATKITLKPYKNQILKEVAEHGQQAGVSLAGELCGYKGYGFNKWLKDITGDENFGLHPTHPKTLGTIYWALRLKADQNYLELVSALESVASEQRRAVEAQEKLRQSLQEVMEARKQGAPANEYKLCEIGKPSHRQANTYLGSFMPQASH